MRDGSRALLCAAILAGLASLPVASAQAQPSVGPPPEAVAQFCVDTLDQAGDQVGDIMAGATTRAIGILERMDEAAAPDEAIERVANQAKATIETLGGHAVEVFHRFAGQCIDFLHALGADPELIMAVEAARDDAIAAANRAVDRSCADIQNALEEILMNRLEGAVGG